MPARLPSGNLVYKSLKLNGRYSTARGSPDRTLATTRFDTVEDGNVLTSGEGTQMMRSSTRADAA